MRNRCLKMLAPEGAGSGIAKAVADAVETATEVKPEEKPESKEPELTEDAAFFVRRVAEEVTKGVAALLNPPKPAEEETEDKPKKRKPPERKPERKGISLGFSLFKR